MTKNIFTIAGSLLLLSACSIREEVQVHADNSVGRSLNFKLDTAATQKLLTLAQQNQAAGRLDSMGFVWDSLAAGVKKNVQQIPGATVTASQWDKKTYTGTLQFNLPSLDAYNQFADNTLAMPSEVSEKLPVGGLKREALTWKGKDTLVIRLDNSRDAAAPGQDDTKQAMSMMKMMLGMESLMQYKVDFKLPKPAKALIGEGAVLSADKKTVSLNQSLDEPNAPGKADEVKVVF